MHIGIGIGLFGGGAAGIGADFTGNVLLGGVTLTRASGATFFDAAGVLQEVGVDVARFEFDRATAAPLGLLIEPARTNLITHPRSIGGTGWMVNNLPTVTAVTALNGAAEAAELTENVGGGSKTTNSPSISFTSGTTYTNSAILRAGTRSFAQLLLATGAFGADVWQTFDLSAGALGSGGSANVAAGMQNLGGGNWLCWVTGTATATTASVAGIAMAPAATTTRAPSFTGSSHTIIAQFAQVTANAAPPTSRVLPPPGSPAATTRAADVAAYAAPNGTWDELIQDTAGGEWRAGITVSGGSRTITPRTGRFHVRRVRLFPAGTAAANPGWAVAA